MFDALADYPIYEPPHGQGPDFLRHPRGKSDEEYERLVREFVARGRANFSYFMEHRDARLTALRTLLSKFNANMDVDDTGLAAVSAWRPGNCGVLVANLRERETRQAFFQHLEPWTERWRGFNVIFDLGVFFGECVIARNQRLHWKYQPGASDDGSANHSGYGIDGFRKRRDWLDPPGYMYGECRNAEVDVRNGEVGRFLRKDTLVGIVRDYSTR